MNSDIDKFVGFFGIFFICLICVSSCWLGLEYILEGIMHNSITDGVVAIVLSYFMANKYTY